jgi:hypothetical protein
MGKDVVFLTDSYLAGIIIEMFQLKVNPKTKLLLNMFDQKGLSGSIILICNWLIA